MIKLRKKPVVVEGEQWFKVDKDKVRGNYHLNVGYFRRPDIPGKCSNEKAAA